MEARALGRTGFAVSRLILGCGGFGGLGSDPALVGLGESDVDAERIMDAAWDAGIRTFDTADAYAGGRSELVIGRWIRSRRRTPTIATKTFHPMCEGADRGLAPARIRRQVESSLQRLGVDRVDLFLTHEPDAATPLGDTLDALDGLVAEGKIGAYGGSHVTADLLREAEGRYAWLQNSYSLLDRTDEDEVLPLVQEAGLGYTPYSPLAGGWLTGKYRRDRAAPPNSRMALRPGPYRSFDRDWVWDGLDGMRNVAEDTGRAMTSLAYAWTLADPRVTAILVGPRNVAQLSEAVAALHTPLDAASRSRLSSCFPRPFVNPVRSFTSDT